MGSIMSARRMVAVLAGVTLAAALTAEAAEPPTITAAQAGEYVGKRVKVCGEIAAVGQAFAKREGGKQIFLHFDKAPPGSPFVAVVIGYDLEKFWRLDSTAVHRRACVTGYVKRNEAMIYGLVDAMNQMTFTDDKPQ
jgi:hypothetical protein